MLCAILLSISLFPLPLWAQGTDQVVSEIVFHGQRRIPAETMRSRIFTKEGDIFDPASIERDFNSLWNTGYFEDVRFEREDTDKGVILHIYVKERPTIRRIEYKGLNAVPQSDVLERFKKEKVGLSVESQYDPTKVKKAEVVLRSLLAENGRQFAEIRTEIRPIPPAAVEVNFNIKEGPKVKVGRIKFEGNKHVGDRTLRNAMANSKPIGIPRSIILENIFDRTFNAAKLGEDAERIRFELQKRGFFKAIVGDPQTSLRDVGGSIFLFGKGAGKRVDITVPIEEGDRYRLGSITFTGNKAIQDQRVLRGIFPMKDGDIFNREKIAKGLENLTKAYSEIGYINFTPVPETTFDEDKKLINMVIDVDEGRQFSVRRIEFTGNTTTRDKVIRRELAVEEGGVYNGRAWEISLLRLNQLGYFEQLKPEEDSEIRRNEQDATVDLTLKVKEKGKNSIGLTGGVSGLAGSFIGLNYETNNFLGLGETLRIEANVGSRERNILFGFTEPYLFDRPIQFGFTVFSRRFDFDERQQTEILTGREIDLPENVLESLQNFSQATTGFTVSSSYQLRRSFKRVGLTYSWDTSTTTVFSQASRQLFEQLAFRTISGQDALKGVVTSKVLPTFSFSTINSQYRPTSGKSLFIGGEVTGLGGNVSYLRPIVEWKHFMPSRRNVFGYRVQGSFITGYRGNVAPPFERFYSGGDADLRGFDIRSISPYVFLTDVANVDLINPDDPCLLNVNLACSGVLRDPANPRAGRVTVPLPITRLVRPGGDTNIIGNVEYRVPIVGPVTLAAFADFGLNFVMRDSQLKISDVQVNDLNSTVFGCPVYDPTSCSGGRQFNFSQTLSPISGTNFVPRMSTGLEFQVILPIVNAPFRIYYAYNPLLLDKQVQSPAFITRDMFPNNGAGEVTFQRSLTLFGPDYRLKEPRKTFRFTVSTTF